MNVEPWQARLAEGDSGGAWELFLGRYRRLIFATTRRLLREEGEAFEAFDHVQGRLLDDNLGVLRRYRDGPGQAARFSTWLVTVVHNLVVDWVRHRDGRPRSKLPEGLSPLQQRIYVQVFVEHRSHAEAYGLLAAQEERELPFPRFLRELAATYRTVGQSSRNGVARRLAPGPPPMADREEEELGRLATESRRAILGEALGTLPAEERLALHLYVEEELPAAEVATLLGWPNAKTVYNRVYRGLRALREVLEARGVRWGDL